MYKTANITKGIQLPNTYQQNRLRCFICGSILDDRRKCLVEIGYGRKVAICNRRQCEEIALKSKNSY